MSPSSGAHFSRALALARNGAGPRANARGSRQQGLRVFIDANVLFSAALAARGTASALLRLADTAGADCASSAHAWAEADRNLAAKAPHALHTLGLIHTVVGSVPDAMAAHVERALAARVVVQDARCWRLQSRVAPPCS